MIIDNHVHIAGPPHNDEMLDFPVYDGRTSLRVPDADIIIGHVGDPRFMDLLAIVHARGLYVDTSMALHHIVDLCGLAFVTILIRKVGVEKVLFGSDWSGDISRMRDENLDVIEKLGLSRDEKEMILGGYISRILNIQ